MMEGMKHLLLFPQEKRFLPLADVEKKEKGRTVDKTTKCHNRYSHHSVSVAGRKIDY